MRNLRPWVVGIFVCLASACTRSPAPRPLPPAPPPTPAELHESPLVAPGQIELEITDWHEAPSPDKKTVTLTGRLINGGDRTTRAVAVTIDGRDANDAVVLSAKAAPSTDTIPPDGTATFSVTVENRPDVVRYHVEALAR